MLLAVLAWSGLIVLVRALSGKYSAFELLLIRNVVAVAFLTPVLLQTGIGVLRTTRLPMHCLRVVFAYLGMAGMFYAIAEIPLAEVVSLSFTQPLFVVILGALILGEAVNGRRWVATGLGFLGVLIVMRPGFEAIGFATLVALSSAAFYGGSNICIKLLMKTDTPTQSVVFVNLLMIPLSLVPAVLTWVTPTPADFALMVGIGLLGVAGIFFLSQAYNITDASAVVPYDFLRLPLTAVAGWFLFNETVDVFTLVGAGVIFAGTWMLAVSETKKT